MQMQMVTPSATPAQSRKRKREEVDDGGLAVLECLARGCAAEKMLREKSSERPAKKAWTVTWARRLPAF